MRASSCLLISLMRATSAGSMSANQGATGAGCELVGLFSLVGMSLSPCWVHQQYVQPALNSPGLFQRPQIAGLHPGPTRDKRHQAWGKHQHDNSQVHGLLLGCLC